jgi:hypothetical protein
MRPLNVSALVASLVDYAIKERGKLSWYSGGLPAVPVFGVERSAVVLYSSLAASQTALSAIKAQAPTLDLQIVCVPKGSLE